MVSKRGDDPLDYLTGVIRGVTAQQVDFHWEGQGIPVKRKKVAALAYYHPSKDGLSEPTCRIVAQQGMSLEASSVSLRQDRLKVVTAAGAEFELPIGLLIEADYSLGKVMYISDLKPARVKWSPWIELSATARNAPRNAGSDASHQVS